MPVQVVQDLLTASQGVLRVSGKHTGRVHLIPVDPVLPVQEVLPDTTVLQITPGQTTALHPEVLRVLPIPEEAITVAEVHQVEALRVAVQVEALQVEALQVEALVVDQDTEDNRKQ